MKRKLMTMIAVVAVCVAGSAFAALLDLNGVDRTVTDVADLAGYEGVTNSSETQAKLTFNVATDMAYAGMISGNIRLVKEGTGMLDLSGDSSYTGGTEINQGRLMASSLTAFGDVSGAISVKSDCQQTSMTSNKVTCVVFNAAGEFAYPINTSAWTRPAEGPDGEGGKHQYNVAVLGSGTTTTLSGKITGGGLSVHFGGLHWENHAAKPSSGSELEISGEIDCRNGTCYFGRRENSITVSGKITALGIYQASDNASWHCAVELGGSGNSIGVIDVGGGKTSDFPIRATAADALGGATI